MSNLGNLIWKAVRDGKKDVLARLLNGGVDPNVFCYEEKDEYGRNMTALIAASFKRDTEMVNMLVHAGADSDYQDSQYGYTALIWASCGGNTATVQALLQFGEWMDCSDVGCL